MPVKRSCCQCQILSKKENFENSCYKRFPRAHLAAQFVGRGYLANSATFVAVDTAALMTYGICGSSDQVVRAKFCHALRPVYLGIKHRPRERRMCVRVVARCCALQGLVFRRIAALRRRAPSVVLYICHFQKKKNAAAHAPSPSHRAAAPPLLM